MWVRYIITRSLSLLYKVACGESTLSLAGPWALNIYFPHYAVLFWSDNDNLLWHRGRSKTRQYFKFTFAYYRQIALRESTLLNICGSRCIVKLWTCGHVCPDTKTTINIYLSPPACPIVLDILLNPRPLQPERFFHDSPLALALPFPKPTIYSFPVMNYTERRVYDMYEE